MKPVSLLLSAAFLFASSSAFAINPCKSIRLKTLECNVVDATNGTHARILVERSVTAGGSRPSCTTGEVQESIAVYPSFSGGPGNEKLDLLFAKDKLQAPLQALEAGGTIDTDLYSAGLEINDLAAHLKMLSASGAIQAHLALRGTAQADGSSVAVNGSAICSEQH